MTSSRANIGASLLIAALICALAYYALAVIRYIRTQTAPVVN